MLAAPSAPIISFEVISCGPFGVMMCVLMLSFVCAYEIRCELSRVCAPESVAFFRTNWSNFGRSIANASVFSFFISKMVFCVWNLAPLIVFSIMSGLMSKYFVIRLLNSPEHACLPIVFFLSIRSTVSPSERSLLARDEPAGPAPMICIS